jgi:succinate dehydrogenase/fumarate reductase flavoprotein subunit
VEADVAVVGFGAAGVAASVTAHDLGAEVVILEKARPRVRKAATLGSPVKAI